MESLKRGIVLPTNVQDAGAWDDSAILDVFERAIKSHRTKNQQSAGGKKNDVDKLVQKGEKYIVEQNMSGNGTPSNDHGKVSRKRSSHVSFGFPNSSSDTHPTNISSAAIDSSEMKGDATATSDAFADSEPSRMAAGNAAVPEGVVEDAFNAMLMSWYQSGYATGRYQALLEMQSSSRNSRDADHTLDS
jgi:hypothetical protein